MGWALAETFEAAVGAEGIASLDRPVANWFAAHRAGWLNGVAETISTMGGGIGAVAIAGIVGLIWWRRSGSWRPMLVIASSLGGAVGLSQAIKHLTANPTPQLGAPVRRVGLPFGAYHRSGRHRRVDRMALLSRKTVEPAGGDLDDRSVSRPARRLVARLPERPLAHRCDRRVDAGCGLAGGRRGDRCHPVATQQSGSRSFSRSTGSRCTLPWFTLTHRRKTQPVMRVLVVDDEPRQIAETGVWTPILMLTTKDGEWDESEALDTGADDHLSKPFSAPSAVPATRWPPPDGAHQAPHGPQPNHAGGLRCRRPQAGSRSQIQPDRNVPSIR